jgi:hypothetical protein
VVNRIKSLAHTLRYLKARQVFYQVFYRARNVLGVKAARVSNTDPVSFVLKLDESIPSQKSYFGNHFTFLNQSKSFGDGIDWNWGGNGKLWVYNLNYFDYLHQEGLTANDGSKLMLQYCKEITDDSVGLDPYPISLRGINWIKFLCFHKIACKHCDRILHHHYCQLTRSIEYHLMGNHLLENGFSLLFASFYFRSVPFYEKAKRILVEELEEQILQDGGHFERSPMYHQILLFRLLDSVNLLRNNDWQNDGLLTLLTTKGSLMVGWISNMLFTRGEVPMVNDCAHDIAPRPTSILKFFTIINRNITLNQSIS